MFCFHHAGGGASLFRGWAEKFGPAVQVVPVLLPGRERRRKEPRFNDLQLLVNDIEAEIGAHLDERPYVLFGHSMGALIAYRLAIARRDRKRVAPHALFVSGCQAPSMLRKRVDFDVGDEALRELLLKIGGQPREIVEHPEWLSLFLPVLRDDLRICNTLCMPDQPALNCPIYALGGLQDKQVAHPEIRSWVDLAAGSFESRFFEGGHFFMRDSPQEFFLYLSQKLAESEVMMQPVECFDGTESNQID